MDIYQRLKQDHEAASQLLERLEQSSPRDARQRSELLSDLRDELMTHMLAEQEVLYNTLLERIDEQDLLLESVEEHALVEQLIDDIESAGVGDRRFNTRVSTLRNAVDEHVAKEEDLVFETARKHLADDEAQALGDRLKARKQEIA